MSDVVVFHHALGLTPGVTGFADALRSAGHTVHTPDLFEGATFATIAEGMAHVEELGFGAVIGRGAAAVEALPEALAYVGFSLGVLPAQYLAQTRPGATAAAFCYSCVPVSEFGERWPAGVPVQVHGAEDDPVFAGEGDLDAARELVASADDGELFLYGGDAHYFADPTQPGYDPASAQSLLDRVLDLLSR
jgi:dienelactone hydrolase